MIKYKKIFIDPGHGGFDPGAVNKKMKAKEAKVVLDVAKELKKLFTSDLRKFKFTRKTNISVVLNDRWKKANNWKADVSLCIHANSWPSDKSVRGTEVYYYGNNDKRLAEILSKSVSKALGINNRGAKEHAWAMTKYPTMPAVLIEIDYISNDTFAKNCRREEYIKKIAKAIYDGFREWENS